MKQVLAFWQNQIQTKLALLMQVSHSFIQVVIRGPVQIWLSQADCVNRPQRLIPRQPAMETATPTGPPSPSHLLVPSRGHCSSPPWAPVPSPQTPPRPPLSPRRLVTLSWRRAWVQQGTGSQNWRPFMTAVWVWVWLGRRCQWQAWVTVPLTAMARSVWKTCPSPILPLPPLQLWMVTVDLDPMQDMHHQKISLPHCVVLPSAAVTVAVERSKVCH